MPILRTPSLKELPRNQLNFRITSDFWAVSGCENIGVCYSYQIYFIHFVRFYFQLLWIVLNQWFGDFNLLHILLKCLNEGRQELLHKQPFFFFHIIAWRPSLSSNSRGLIISDPIILVQPIMVDHNTCKLVTGHLEEAISRLTLDHSKFSTKIESILDHLATIHFPYSSSSWHYSLPSPSPKTWDSCFNGSDLMIFKITQFSYYQGIPKEDCISLASFFMDSLAPS